MILVADTRNKWIMQIFSNSFICLLPQSIWETSIKWSVFWKISRRICLIFDLYHISCLLDYRIWHFPALLTLTVKCCWFIIRMFIDYLFTYLFLLLRTWTFCANFRLINFSTAFIPTYFNASQWLRWWWWSWRRWWWRYVVVVSSSNDKKRSCCFS